MERSVYYQSRVVTGSSRVIKKSNGKSEYVLHRVEIIEGPCEGQVLTVQHTIKNGNGLSKRNLEIGEIVLFYPRILVDESGNKRVTGEITEMVRSTASEEVLSVLETVSGIETVKVRGEFGSVVRDQTQVLGS